MVYLIPSLTDLQYKNSAGQTVAADDPIESKFTELSPPATYRFKGWITNERLIDITYPGGVFSPGGEEGLSKAFYVDEDIVLWDDCSNNEKRDLCIPGRKTKLELTKTTGATGTATIMSSKLAPEAGWFFRFPKQTQLSVQSNKNFNELVQFDTGTRNWSTSFSFDMWARFAQARDIALSGPDANSVVDNIGLFLMGRSQLIADKADGPKYNSTGYDFYWKIRDGKMYASNYNPTSDLGSSLRNILVTPPLEPAYQQPGTLSNEWSNIVHGWTYFGFSYDAETRKLVGIVKQPNAHFTISAIGTADPTITAGEPNEDCRDYGVLVGGLGYNYTGGLDKWRNDPEMSSKVSTFVVGTPQVSAKAFRIYNRALSLSAFEKIYDIEKPNFRPSKIRSRFVGAFRRKDGTIGIAGQYYNGANDDPYMYTKVVEKNANQSWDEATEVPSNPGTDYNPKSQWNSQIRFPRQLSDYVAPGNDFSGDGYDTSSVVIDGKTYPVARFIPAPSATFLGWSMRTEATTAETIFTFPTLPSGTKTFISTGTGYGMRRTLYPVVVKTIVYHNKKTSSTTSSLTLNFGATIHGSLGGGVVVSEGTGWTRLVNSAGGGWTTSSSATARNTPPALFMPYSQSIDTWTLLSKILNHSGDLHLYPIYIKAAELYQPDDCGMSWTDTTEAGSSDTYHDGYKSTSVRPYAEAKDAPLTSFTVRITNKVTAHNDHHKDCRLSVYVYRYTNPSTGDPQWNLLSTKQVYTDVDGLYDDGSPKTVKNVVDWKVTVPTEYRGSFNGHNLSIRLSAHWRNWRGSQSNKGDYSISANVQGAIASNPQYC